MVATILIAALLAAGVWAIVAKLARDRRAGKSSCGCGCGNCPSAGMCHPDSQAADLSRQQ